jgi:hypothetical protein
MHDNNTRMVDTPAVELNLREWQHAFSGAADVALERGDAVVVLGRTSEHYLITCPVHCPNCMRSPGAIVILPDVKEAEYAANGIDDMPPGFRIVRDDGREALMFPAGGDATGA